MNCNCGGDLKTIDSRHVEKSRKVPIENSTRRRHVCLKCGERITTYEVRESSLGMFEAVKDEAERLKTFRTALMGLVGKP